jgi:hypothetical protein
MENTLLQKLKGIFGPKLPTHTYALCEPSLSGNLDRELKLIGALEDLPVPFAHVTNSRKGEVTIECFQKGSDGMTIEGAMKSLKNKGFSPVIVRKYVSKTAKNLSV